MPSARLVAIINSYNRLPLLQVGLPSLLAALKQCPFSTAVVIFDAGSTDGTLDWLEGIRASCQTIPLEVISPAAGQDSSFSAGVNRACLHAIAAYQDVELFFLFETDNWIESAAPILLAKDLLDRNSKLAAAGFTISLHDGKKIGFGCPFPTPFTFLLGQQLTLIFHLEDRLSSVWTAFENSRWAMCDIVFTSPLLIKRTAWEESGGMDNRAFPFTDCDADWCWRVKKLGKGIAVLAADGVVHDNKGLWSQWSAKRVLDYHRARLTLLRTHTQKSLSWLKPLLFLRHSLELMLLLLALPLSEKAATSIKKRWLLLTSVFNDYSTH